MPLRKEKLLVCEKVKVKRLIQKSIYAGLTKKMTASNILLSQRASLGKEKSKKSKKKREPQTHPMVWFVILCFFVVAKPYVIPETLPYYFYMDNRKKRSDAGNEERCVLQEDLFSS